MFFPFFHTGAPEVTFKPLTVCATSQVSEATCTFFVRANVRTQANLNYIYHDSKQFIAVLSDDVFFIAPCCNNRISLCGLSVQFQPITN